MPRLSEERLLHYSDSVRKHGVPVSRATAADLLDTIDVLTAERDQARQERELLRMDNLKLGQQIYDPSVKQDSGGHGAESSGTSAAPLPKMDVAARIGDFLKFKVMGWVQERKRGSK